jgi:hypothetical protein
MRCDRALTIACIAALLAGSVPAADMRIVTAAILAESGQAAPVIELRSVGDDGLIRRLSVSGWTIAATRDAPVDRGRRVILTFSVTPYDAHSSRRMYSDGSRARELEFDDAAVAARAAYRIREGERASTEAALIAGQEIVGSRAPHDVRDRWRTPYAGVQIAQRIRVVTAEDPYASRIEGIDLTAATELFSGRKTWSRTTLLQSAGAAAGPFHFRQSMAAMYGTNLDTISAFLVGGSWDALGPMALYGTRYAEFRLEKCAVLSGGADYALRSWELGVRASVMRAPRLHASGTMLGISRRAAGIHFAAGAGKSQGRTTFVASVSAAAFRP